MSEQPAQLDAILRSESASSVLPDADSEMAGPTDMPEPPGTMISSALLRQSTPAPDIAALLESMVSARMSDWEQQAVAQSRAWKEQETAMQLREQELLQNLNALKERLALAEAAALARPGEQESRPIIAPAVADSNVKTVPAKRRKISQGAADNDQTLVRSSSRKDVGSAGTARIDSAAAAPETTRIEPAAAETPAWILGPPGPPTGTTRSKRRLPKRSGPNNMGPPPPTRVTRSVSRLNVTSQLGADSQANPNQALGAYPFMFSATMSVPPKKKKKKAVQKSAAEVFRYLPQDMPDDMGGLNKAMALHIRILWGFTSVNDVPKNPPAQMLTAFHRRFSNEAQLYATHKDGEELIPRHLIQIGNAMSMQPGRLGGQARLLEEHILEYTQTCLARFGLSCWCPDMRLSAYSLYNSACRIIALDTFKQALVSHAYAHVNPSPKYMSNMNILINLFDHFVFHYMKNRYLTENHNPGAVAQQLKKSPQYMARIRLANARLKFLAENNYPKRYEDLIDSKATSDDEYDSRKRAWIINRRPERSAKAEKFFRLLDAKRREVALQEGAKWRERKRIVPDPDVQKDSPFFSLPSQMPVDYFDPDFFNKLQPKTRNRIAVAKASLLPNIDRSFTWNADERRSDQSFTRKYGARLLTQYDMVSDADMVQMVNEEGTDDEWAGIEDEDAITQKAGSEDLVDLRAVASSRDNLSSRLSDSQSQSHLSSTTTRGQSFSSSRETRSNIRSSSSAQGSMESIH